MKNTYKKTWIIGASSGIGAALAEALSERGEVLCLSARSKENLDNLRDTLSEKSSLPHLSIACDVSDHNQIHEALENLVGTWGHIDRIIFMAGAYSPASLDELDLRAVDQIIDVNLKSAFFLLYSALPVMKDQGYGQIALCASVAGYRGLPNSQPYGASKAGLISLAETLRTEKGQELDIKVINPGFVESRLTDKNDFPMPMKISAQEAANSIIKDLDTKKFEIHFPKKFTRLMKLIQVLPDWLYFRIMRQRS